MTVKHRRVTPLSLYKMTFFARLPALLLAITAVNGFMLPSRLRRQQQSTSLAGPISQSLQTTAISRNDLKVRYSGKLSTFARSTILPLCADADNAGTNEAEPAKHILRTYLKYVERFDMLWEANRPAAFKYLEVCIDYNTLTRLYLSYLT